MTKNNKVKFFLVAATLVGSFGFKAFAQDASEDPNLDGKTFAADTAVEKPYASDCHECAAAARASGPRGKLFEPPGIAATGKSKDQNTTQ